MNGTSNDGTRIDRAALEFYRLQWRLSDVCAFAATFRAPHLDDENTRVAWSSLEGYLHSL
ncbi:hypothetical protein LVJ94_48885 [Pendulispora rubella]|uniref:Transposase n=1 Tax=Pendulispora rubella TaxID=2741070 RepID=A0ABZ2L4A4_9BACT